MKSAASVISGVGASSIPSTSASAGLPNMTMTPKDANAAEAIAKSRSVRTQAAYEDQFQKKKKRYLRTAAGMVWEDPNLNEWDPNDFRMFCGDLGQEVDDETLRRAFSHYESFKKAHVVRDKRTNKSRGYGFVSFSDPNDFTRALREVNGKYVGNRPIKLKKSNWRSRQLEVQKKRDKEKKKLGLKI
ncbi:unnamed protein product [Protopolystoma xenopodis]|uniref:RNA-binding protein 42 n=1 Tax=Protopolystoma xenopodis TaxID=117903 RepID=A0A448XH21_9PLAT|nr:unnamed protein product [Protopolystoma xenopodis]